MFLPKPLDIFHPEGRCSEGLDAFRFFLNTIIVRVRCVGCTHRQFQHRNPAHEIGVLRVQQMVFILVNINNSLQSRHKRQRRPPPDASRPPSSKKLKEEAPAKERGESARNEAPPGVPIAVESSAFAKASLIPEG